MTDVVFTAAGPPDLPAIRDLLDRCSLPFTDLVEEHLEDFLTCRASEEIVGVVGLERSGEAALLRSLAVSPERRGRAIGHRLWELVRERARTAGVKRLYLLTTTASTLFERWGFVRISREALPDALKATPELTTLCPSSAIVMAQDLT